MDRDLSWKTRGYVFWLYSHNTPALELQNMMDYQGSSNILKVTMGSMERRHGEIEAGYQKVRLWCDWTVLRSIPAFSKAYSLDIELQLSGPSVLPVKV